MNSFIEYLPVDTV